MTRPHTIPGLSYQMVVGAAEAGHTVRSIVQQRLHLSRRMLRQLVVNNSIRSNQSVVYLTARVAEGDVINVMLPEETTDIAPETMPIDVRYEDAETLIVNKPPGVLTHPTAREREGSLLALAYGYLKPLVPHCVHRLDRETSGLVMLAKHGHFHHLYDETLRQGKIHRVYCALVHLDDDNPYLDWDTIDLPIAQDPNAPSRRVIAASGQRAITHYRILKVKSGIALVMIVLETGRTHQIRLHFRATGQPLVGDKVYGNGLPSELGRQALHAVGMWFVHPVTKQEHRVFADIPNDFLSEWSSRGGEAGEAGDAVRSAFLETEIFANIEGREEL